jgi:methionyl-tRNA formyltransferase
VKFAFAGSPEFASWVLEHLSNLGRRPVLVISQPDRPRGRGRRPDAPPAVRAASRLGLDCLQTDDINAPALTARLQKAGVCVLVVASFGQILKTPLLEALLCLNIHASLLPAYRGAAPIERALMAGEEEIGVTIMRVTETLDAGPWALQTRVSVNLTDDAGSLRRVLALVGALGVDQVLTAVGDGTVAWREQEGPSSYAAKLTAADCVANPERGAKAFHDQVRALSPQVGVRARSGGVEFKIWRSWPYGQPGLRPLPPEAAWVGGRAGRLLASSGRLYLGCEEGAVELLAIQPSGRPRMSAAAFLRGYSRRLGEVLEPPSLSCSPAVWVE